MQGFDSSIALPCCSELLLMTMVGGLEYRYGVYDFFLSFNYIWAG